MKSGRVISALEIIFPVTLRTLILLFLGPLLFAINLEGIKNYNIPPAAVLDLEEDIIPNSKKIFLVFFATVFLPAFIIYNFFSPFDQLFLLSNDPNWHYQLKVLFVVTAIVSFILLVQPLDYLYKKERYALLKSTFNIIFNDFQSAVPFSEVLLADIFTSYSRVFGDFFSNFWDALFGSDDIKGSNMALWSDVLTPLVIALPFFLRLKQCCSEFFHSNCSEYKHLANALKYASAFPVVFLNPIVSKMIYNEQAIGNFLFYTWLILVLFNSLYSFYWDLVMDWNLASYKDGKKTLLSRSLLFNDKYIYYFIIVINFILRITWVLKLSNNNGIAHAPFSNFFFELLELLRRFFWVFLRLEKQYLDSYQVLSS